MIEGLTIIENYISDAEEVLLIDQINQQEWNNSLVRRTQHYGYEYNYTSKAVGDPIQSIPNWNNFLIDRMLKDEYITKKVEQLIINEYKAGQGISKHIDSKIFGNTIISLSLGSSCNMIFRKGSEVIEIHIKPKTLLIMKDIARWKWTHEIPQRKTDDKIARTTRISLTFRYLYDSDPTAK